MGKILRRSSKDITIKEAKKEFVTCKTAEGLSGKTIESYEYAIDYFIKSLTLNINDSVNSITHDKCLEFVTNLQNKDITKSGKNHFINSIRVFLYWLMSEHYINEFKIKLIKGQDPKIKLYTDDELSKLMDKPKKDCTFIEYRQWVMVAFILSTGARATTLVNIKVDDLDLTKGTVAFTHLKNKKSVIIPIPVNMVKILKEYIKTWGINDYLFPTQENEQLTYNGLETTFRRYCKSRGVECTGLHTLRHTFCSSLVKQNVSPFIIQKIMTHSSIAVTEKYVHLFSDDLKEVIDVAPVNQFLNGKKIIRHKT